MDISLYYQEEGLGDAFILLHGNGEDSTYFINQIKFFSNKYKVIAIDTRGHGKTRRGELAFNIDQFKEDLNNFMIEKNISKAIILGFSDGANIAMKFALKYQHKIKALILNGGNTEKKGVKRRVQIPIEIGYRIANLFSNKSEEAKHNAEILSLMTNKINVPFERLREIKVPTLVIAGTNDMIKKNHTKQIANSIPNAKLRIIKGNHFIANKKPKEFNREIENFLLEIE